MKGDFTRFGFGLPQVYSAVLLQQGRVPLDADWNEQRAIAAERVRADGAAIIGDGVPWDDPGFEISATSDGTGLTIGPGSLHVGGVLCRNASTLAYVAQPDSPNASLPAGAGRYVVYLDVWDRHVSDLEDASLREPALGGVDTTTRVQTLWQVACVSAGAPLATGSAFGPTWNPLWPPSTGTMMAATQPPVADGIAVLPPQAGYRSLQNHLYRVEVHGSGTVGGTAPPTFKWSRDNGSAAALVTAIAGNVITLSGDPSRFLAAWVEIIRPEDVLHAAPTVLLRVIAASGTANTLTIDPATPIPQAVSGSPVEPGLMVRRWDQPPASGGPNGIAMTTAAAPLEAGIVVTFSAGTYRCGDYWLIPARTAISAETGGILWPAGTFQPPRSIEHRVAPLALIDAVGNPVSLHVVQDCRAGFVPRTGLPGPLRAYVRRADQWTALPDGADLPLDQLQDGLLVAAAAPLAVPRATPGLLRLEVDVPLSLQQAGGGPEAGLTGVRSIALHTQLKLVATNQILVTPRLVALEFLFDLLATDAAKKTVLSRFEISPPDAPWVANPDGSLSVTLPAGNDVMATARMVAAGPIQQLSAVFSQSWGYSGGAKVGVAFEIGANGKGWTFAYSRSVGGSATGGSTSYIEFTLTNPAGNSAFVYLHGDAIGSGKAQMTITSDPAGGPSIFAYTLDPGLPSEKVCPIDFSGATFALPKAFAAGTKIGILAHGPTATFHGLTWTRPGGGATTPIPLAPYSMPLRLIGDGSAFLPSPVNGQTMPERRPAIADMQLLVHVGPPLQGVYTRYDGYGQVFGGFGSERL